MSMQTMNMPPTIINKPPITGFSERPESRIWYILAEQSGNDVSIPYSEAQDFGGLATRESLRSLQTTSGHIGHTAVVPNLGPIIIL